jgi:hypothetical protein
MVWQRLHVVVDLQKASHNANRAFTMGDFPVFEYSNRDVRRVGDLIAGDLPWTEETAPQIREAFRIANSWRDAHAYPMRSLRYSVIGFMRHNGIEGITVARLKRMQAIRRKLRRIQLNLNQLQDLAGCRAILGTISEVHVLVDALRKGSKHELRAENDYILQPKEDGYRSHHLMFKYRGKGPTEIYNDRRIEVQIRTRLQHSWATAVEAVGLFRGEDLKAHVGSEQWLRLFKLMSAEFCLVEGCPEPPDTFDQAGRIAEIRRLDKELGAIEALEKLSHAARWTDIAVSPSTRPTYYLIKFDNNTKQVEVSPIFAPRSALESYDKAELGGNLSGVHSKNIVLVEADKLENLKAAYPNYFGDTQLFKTQLKKIVTGTRLEEYIVRPQDTVVPRPRENPDLSWLRKRLRWK